MIDVRKQTVFLVFSSGLAAAAPSATAVDTNVRLACIGDYMALCSSHVANSEPMRQCMRVNGAKLSSRCIDALANAGEITRDDQERYQKAQRNVQR
jgi:hypothetical protein